MPRGVFSLQWRLSLQLQRARFEPSLRLAHTASSAYLSHHAEGGNESPSKAPHPSREVPRSTVSISNRERLAFEKVLKKIARAETKTPRPFTNHSVQKAEEKVQRFPKSLQSAVRDVENKALHKSWVSKRHQEELGVKPPDVSQKKHEITKDIISRELKEARKDVEILEILEEKLFSQAKLHGNIAELPNMTGKQRRILKKAIEKNKKETVKSLIGSEVRLNKDEVAAIYSDLLILALQLLKRHFPSSSLPLVIYAKMKDAGLYSYALAASTELYNLVIEASWKYYGDVHQIVPLLKEMNKNGLDFDSTTVDLIGAMIESFKSVNTDVPSAILEAEQKGDLKTLIEWKEIIVQRMEEAAAREANELLEIANGRQWKWDS